MDNIDTTAPPPPAPPARIDPPHRHSRRQFLSEIAIVVIGVLLALGAEQIVQWWNWQSEVEESREAINAEIGYNLVSRKRRQDQSDCIDRRLDDLQRWHDSWVAGKPLKLSARISAPSARVLQFDAWNVALTGQVAAHIPLDDRIRYARLYSFFRSYEGAQTIDSGYWAELQKFDNATVLSPRDLMELQGLIINLRDANRTRRSNWRQYEPMAREFGISIGRDDWDVALAAVCKSLFADSLAPAS